MHRPVFLAAGLVSLGVALWVAGSAQNGQSRKVEFGKDVRPLLQKYCSGCHSGKDPAAGLNLTLAKSDRDIQKSDKDWDRVTRALSTSHMPPPSAAQPSQEQRKGMVAAIESILTGNCTLQDPGRVTIRRLNRTEYANTIRDLLGVEFKATGDFPSDDVGYGFDNIGDVLTISPLLMEKYLDAAEKISETAIAVSGSNVVRYDAERFSSSAATNTTIEGDRNFFVAGVSTVDHDVPVAGLYRLIVTAFGQQAGPEPCKMQISVDGKPVQSPIDVRATVDNPTNYEVPAELTTGKHKIGVAFLNDYYKPDAPNPKDRDRNFILRQLEVVGPIGGTGAYPETTTQIIPVQPTRGGEIEAAQRYLAAFATRAYRRPVTQEETDALMRVFKVPFGAREPFNRCMQVAISAVLVSPQFLFRVELDPKGSDTKLLNSYEIASRLSYFLWSSMPDAELFSLASQGKLNDPKMIEAQVDRMLRDPKSRALSNTFAEQWLQLRKIEGIRPDPKRFTGFQNSLRNLMVQESKLFFNDVLANDRSILEFLDSRYTFLNGALAAHYGVPDVSGPEMRRVELPPGTQRGGLLGQGAILMLTSNPTRTSPTKRGKWILEQILGTPPPPPPPGADQLKPIGTAGQTLTLRQQLEVHRQSPDCASCHARMDPLGFALENYNAVGQWRTADDQNAPIDSKGQLPDGATIDGPAQLKAVLLAKKDMFARSLSEKLSIYALGRGVTLRDDCALDDIAKRCKENGYRISAMIKAIAVSEPFRKKRAEQP